MPIRGTVWFQLGDPIEGLRFGPPLHSRWAASTSDIFHKLERIIEDVYSTLAPQPPTTWLQLSESAQPPKINGRKVILDIRMYRATIPDESANSDTFVIMRARLPFRVWPLGGWVVVEGWNRTREGEWALFTTEELEKGW